MGKIHLADIKTLEATFNATYEQAEELLKRGRWRVVTSTLNVPPSSMFLPDEGTMPFR